MAEMRNNQDSFMEPPDRIEQSWEKVPGNRDDPETDGQMVDEKHVKTRWRFQNNHLKEE